MGKKNKKTTKGKSVSLAEFLGTDNSAGSSVVITNKPSWADEEDTFDDDRAPERIVLPTAPRQARGPNIDMERVPNNPPFIAYVANLPFDVEDNDIERFFNIPIKSIRLPREGGENGRFKGFGYVEFDNKVNLLEALAKNEDVMRNRKIRVDVAEEENSGARRDRSNYSREEREDRSGGVSDWRASREPLAFDAERRDNYGSKYSRGYDRENKDDFERGSKFGGNKYENRGGRFDDRDRNYRNSSSGFGGREPWRPGGRGDRDDRSPGKERPKLQLKPRSVATVETVSTESPQQSSSSIFGSARPVDTASREKQIEDKWQKKPNETPAGKREVSTKDIFGEAKPVDTAVRDREIENRLRKQDKSLEGKFQRDHSRGRDTHSDHGSRASSSRSRSKSPSHNNNEVKDSLHGDDNSNYDVESDSNSSQSKIETKSEPRDHNIIDVKNNTNRNDKCENIHNETDINKDIPKYNCPRISERKLSPKRSDRDGSPGRQKDVRNDYLPRKNYNRDNSPPTRYDRDHSPPRRYNRDYSPPRRSDRDYSPKRRSDRDYSPSRRSDRNYSPKRDRGYSPKRDRGYSPKRDRGYSPKRDRDHSPKRDRDHSPKRDGDHSPKRDGDHSPKRDRDHSPKRDKDHSPKGDRDHSPKGDRDHSPKRDRDHSPKRDRDHSPKRDRDHSPKRDRDHSPKRDRDHSPKRDRDHSPKRDRGYSPKRDRGYSPKRDRGYSPTRSDRDGRRDFSDRDGRRDDRRDYSNRKSDSSNRNEFLRSNQSSYRKYSPRRSDPDRYSPRRYGRDDNKSYSSYRRKDDDYANFSSRKPNRDRDNYSTGFSRDYGKSGAYDRGSGGRNDDYDKGYYRRPAPAKEYVRRDEREESSTQDADKNRTPEETNRNEVHRVISEDVSQGSTDTNSASKVSLEANSKNVEDKKLKRGKKKKCEDVVISTTNKFAQLGLEEEDV